LPGSGSGEGWAPADVGPGWRAAFDGFDWLNDLKELGGDLGRRRARELVGRFLDIHGSWNPLSWRPDVLGRRIGAWLGHYAFFCETADDAFRDRVLDSLYRQACHLTRVVGEAPAGSGRISAIRGLVMAATGFADLERRLPLGLALLETEIARQVLADGGHASRSPSLHLQVLRDLIDIRNALRAVHRDVPMRLAAAIDAMAAILRYFRHGDGSLALFNASNEEELPVLEAAIGQSESRPRLAAGAKETGIERLSAGRTVVFVDVGRPVGLDERAHAGTLAMEMSVGRERLIANLGGAGLLNDEWQAAQRSTAAHSTLAVDDTNSSAITAAGTIQRAPTAVTADRDEVDGQVWLNAAHDGYAERFALQHRRRLYLAADGEDVRGEDVVTGPGSRTFAVRFHLHPRVQVNLAQNAAQALLRLPSGAGFRFRIAGAPLTLGESVYLGRLGEMRRTQHLLATGRMDGAGVQLKWAIRRESKKDVPVG
jgi:uncharacterized heparinase superfamily protein